MNLLTENISHDDLKKYIKELYNYIAKELNIDVLPRVFLRRDKANAEDILGKTGGYDPDAQEIHLYITDRHPKDVLRSFAHELVHHMQKLQGLDSKVNIDLIHKDEAYAQHDEGLREMEREAFEKGNMLFRAWTDGKKMERKQQMAEDKKVPKSVVKKAHKIAKKIAKSGSVKEPYAVGMAAAKKQAGLTEKEKKKAKPDFLDMDKDGDKEETMKKAIKDKADKQAKDDMAARHGKDRKDESGTWQDNEAVEKLQENEKEENKHPYPQLFQEKPRLMQDVFNKKEELVYQELIRRFLKK